jgi:hypothetical protein
MNWTSWNPAAAKASRSSWRVYLAACHHLSMRIFVIQFLRVTTAKKVPFCTSLPRKLDNAWEKSAFAKYSSIEVQTIRS